MEIQKNNWNNWNWNRRVACFFLKGSLSTLYGFEAANEKGQNIKNALVKLQNTGFFPPFSLYFALVTVKNHAKAHCSIIFCCTCNPSKWSSFYIF